MSPSATTAALDYSFTFAGVDLSEILFHKGYRAWIAQKFLTWSIDGFAALNYNN